MEKDTQPLLQPSPYGSHPHPPDAPQPGCNTHQPVGYGESVNQAVPSPQQPRYDRARPTVVTIQPGYTTPMYNPPSDNYLMLSLCTTIFCLNCGAWVALSCTIPAIIAAMIAREAEIFGDTEKKRNCRAIALALNIIGFIFGLLVYIGAWVYIYFRFIKNHQLDIDPY